MQQRSWGKGTEALLVCPLPCVQAGSGGATQYGQQRGGGVSKEVMERVQVGSYL